MICPKCGEDNSENFRFCGMCGTVLEARRPAGAPVPNLPPPRIANAPESPRTPAVENANKPANKPLPPVSMDSLREKSFSGMDSFFEPEQPKRGRWRILLLLVLLAALGGAGWWTYTTYVGVTEGQKQEATTPGVGGTPGETANDSSPTKAASQTAAPVPAPDAGTPPAAVPQRPPETAQPKAKPATKTTPPIPKTTRAEKIKIEKKHAPSVTAQPARLPETAAADSGDAAFRKGEAYLYGRGVHENCDEAVKYLKAASAKSSAKARSTFGTMYATGHCVPRDLPTSYLWFAQALRLDPNNQILEKDLSAVWNQMTPPERQMATRMKQ